MSGATTAFGKGFRRSFAPPPDVSAAVPLTDADPLAGRTAVAGYATYPTALADPGGPPRARAFEVIA